MKIFLNRDYFFNFVKQNKKTIIKVSVGVLVFTLAFFVFCMRQGDKPDFELTSGSESEVAKEISGAHGGYKEETEEANDGRNSEKIEKDAEIFVDVSGAVVNPDVYKLKEGARVYEAIKKAGGFRENANAQNLNLAAKLSDQDKIVVLTDEEVKNQNDEINMRTARTAGAGITGDGKSASQGGASGQSGTQVNINSATAEELQTIKGVGPAMADRILEYRKNNGGFSSVDDLKNVKGIGEKTFAKLKDSIRI